MTLSDPVTLFAMMVFCHLLADYPLQGDFLARAKNRCDPVAGMPWYHALFAHAGIHAGFVLLITGNLWLMLAELVLHALIDDSKCAGRISFNTDQLLHILCKAVWAGLIAVGAFSAAPLL